MNLLKKQIEVKEKIEKVAEIAGIDPLWAVGVAMTESSLGIHQLSPTGCKGVFQLSSIMMKDLLLEMQKEDDEFVDIACGIAALKVLLRRWKTIEEATLHYCDPKDRDFYLQRVKDNMIAFKEE